MGVDRRASLPDTMSAYVHAHPDLIRMLPQYPSKFVKKELDEPLFSKLQKLHSEGIIKQVGIESEQSNRWRHIYQIDERVTELLDDIEDKGGGRPSSFRLPCGHGGFKNLPDSPLYECKTCGKRCTRDEIQTGGASA